MRRRTRGALALLLLLAPATSGACATAGAGGDDVTGGLGPGKDASVETGAGDDAAGPSPDAIVLGIDATGDDASDATAEGPADPPDVGTDGHPSKSCTGLPDGTPCGAAPDICHDAPTCEAGACAAAAAKADGFVCGTAPDECHLAPVCKAGACAPPATRADGYEWTAGDATARCCGGKPVHTTSDSDCGACGIQCNASNGESCQNDTGVYLCRGCVASASCWSRCCSTSFSPNTCAASDCAGNCSAQYCPPGTHCVVGNGTSDYCSY